MATAATAPAVPRERYETETGIWSWLTTVDHKRIGALYLYTALLWFLVNDRIKLLAYRIFDPVKAKAPSDLTPQIAKRAYELYEQRGRQDGRAGQDWGQAEGEIRKKEFLK